MHLPRALYLPLIFASGWGAGIYGQESKDRLVRDTELLSAVQEQATFQVPSGFEVQLFADDAQLGGKPINLGFDRRGRLWVTSTLEYPYAVPKERWENGGVRAKGGRDTIRILEDLDGDGRADRSTVFANELNIPTGVLPYGKGCIAWSIPNIVHFEDTDEDGICDRRTILFGPLGYEKDTHGMISSLRLGLDGWVYATHGFSNTSHFKAKDGIPLDLNSGNVFRFNPDGSRVERWTTGQVNPFGLCWDSRGNLYSADCHSSPIYQLIPGASYPSFGRPHDGLGFAPVMCEHAHGSTGIAGVVYLDQNVWGPEWNDHMLVGNPVTSRVNQDLITFTGSTPKANERPDFLTSTDPWFRPVDLQLGPDRALYIADFYNRIIGHYEVPLDHPGRDRASGRIWRVVKKDATRALRQTALHQMTTEDVITRLGDASLTLRGLAVAELKERLSGPAASEAQQILERVAPENARQSASMVWLEAASRTRPSGVDPLEAIHRVRSLAEKNTFDWTQTDPHLLSVVLETVPYRDHAPEVGQLLDLRARLPEGDLRMQYAWRLAMQSVLRRQTTADWSSLAKGRLDEVVERELLLVVCAIPSPDSARWLLRRLQQFASPAYFQAVGGAGPLLAHVARQAGPELETELVELVEKCHPGDLDAQLELYAAITEGRKRAGQPAGRAVEKWAGSLQSALQSWLIQVKQPGWVRTGTGNNPWVLQQRSSEDGSEGAFLGSLPPGGEKLTGTLRSPDFDLPDQLEFWIAGHSGPTNQPPHGRNVVRLRDALSHEILATAWPPRQDRALPVAWTFSRQKEALKALGQALPRVYLELVDGDSGTAYAWLATGRFTPQPVAYPDDDAQTLNRRIASLAQLVRDFPTPHGVSQLQKVVAPTGSLAPATRALIAEALVTAQPSLQPLAALAREAELAPLVFSLLTQPSQTAALLDKAFKEQPYRTQVKLATAMAATPEQSSQLLKLAPPRVLADPVVTGKLQALNLADITRRLDEITRALPPVNAGLDEMLKSRLTAFTRERGNAAAGEQLFQTNCAVCHRIGVKGNLVGPQLDGIGARGAERLLEDILDPNRAVDPAFRMHFVKKRDGGVLGGLLRREQDDQLIFADAAGQEHAVKKADIAEDQESPYSLMPMGLNEVLAGQALNDLLEYLLARKS
ncbi:PVC-type heme-binding CxxCH protein [Verrucomicrobium spinosum]|uniref:PVC-type heme-binding CxxCH protein n=1 Tax=Verrucomicrobium spinosum TaxID=2736 RepID=UPI0001746953|nr:PVC-type heme-binding CxxCH protein [Verrucomicrobium spinosum]